jgi:hypothetical protein
MPGWVLAASFAALLAVVAALALFRHVWRMVQRTKARRPNPTRAEFVAMLRREVRPETAEFLWERMAFLLPTVAPHPNDHLWNDLPIDESEPMVEWLVDYAHRHGLSAQDWPAWPAGSPCTVRNYARWLELGLARQRAEHARP